jgi:Zn-dependent peptidase ImmA (M78 family)
MTDHGRKPAKWANDLNKILAASLRESRFPVPVEELAVEFSKHRFADAPIVAVKGGSLGSFEGALYPVHEGKGWAIIYNSDVSQGRKRFTIAHEFGHFLMHRSLFPEGLKCDEQSVTFRDGVEYEKEADGFAAYLLMPFDDFRKQLPDDSIPTLDDFTTLADRYGVSLISCIIRWLEYTARRAMLVISRDDFVLWAKPSKSAFKSGIYIRTRGAPPVPVPVNSLIRRRDFADVAREGVLHPPGVWFNEDCTEITVHSDRYDQVLSILLFGRAKERWFPGAPHEPDTYDRFSQRRRGRFGD